MKLATKATKAHEGRSLERLAEQAIEVAEGCGDTPRLSPHYASRGRLVSHSDGTVISSWDYAYDDVGNVTSQTDKDSNVTRYTYDDVYRLTHVDYPSGVWVGLRV